MKQEKFLLLENREQMRRQPEVINITKKNRSQDS